MDFGALFRRKKKADEAAEESAPPPPRPAPAASPVPPEVALLSELGDEKGPSTDEALALFRGLRTSPNESRAIEALLERNTRAALPEPLAIAVASALVDRGDPSRALLTLAPSTSSPALLMRADLLAETGDVGGAIALAERVLLRDLDHPGARDRHRRWRRLAGIAAEPVRTDASAATVVTQEPDAPFRLLREVARGGAGAVYEAEDRELGRRVALKVYHHPERDKAQLAHEARVAAALAGPNVVRVLDADPEHGWIALEWAALGALRDAIRAKDTSRLLPVERWALPIAEALARAHERGWTHLDVKPANVLLRGEGLPVLSDFGIARKIGEPAPPGSLGYLSPERIAGRAADPKDDVFGFGRILEDALDALPGLVDAASAQRLRAIASACTGPDAARPLSGRLLVAQLRIEAP